MTTHMSEKEARRAGLIPAKQRTTRRTAPREKSTTSTCVVCGCTFTTIAAEDRHLNETGHARYASNIEVTA